MSRDATNAPHGGQPVVEAGAPLGSSSVVVIMLHGRNAGPANILDLVPKLDRPNLTYLAPAAAGRTWYPLGFMAEIDQNEPALSSAIAMLESLVARVEAAGVPRARIVLLGFSQGACLASEFAVRHPSRFGGVIIFTGGLIGPPGTRWNEAGSFAGTPIFMGSGDPDGHVPVARVHESAAVFTRMGATVTTRIYPGRGHYVGDDEIASATALIDEVVASAGSAVAPRSAEPAATPFLAQWQACRVLAGADPPRDLARELDAMGWTRALIVTTPGRSETAAEIGAALADRLAGICTRAAPHVPSAAVTAAVAEVDRVAPDVLVAIGGGSAIGLAKAVALARSLPIAAIPTTYAGSEMTSIYGITAGAEKRTGRDARVAPRLVIYQPALTVSLPPGVSAASGMNAIAHAVEAMYAINAPVLAFEAGAAAIRILAAALPRIVANPADLSARALAQRGAHAAGFALEVGRMGLHHRICHVLGGAFDMPHAHTHAALLPHVVSFNAPAAPDAMARIAAALGAPDAAAGLRALNARLGLTASLITLGFRVADIDRAADLVVAGDYPNPRTVTVADVREILRRAAGNEP